MRRSTVPFPRADKDSIAFFRSIVPDDARVQVKPMFGHLAGFVNGNMFVGILGRDVFVRLDEDDRTDLLREEGASTPEPMPGKPMKEYVTIPESWRDDQARVGEWVGRSLEWAERMPEKKPKGKKKR